jgi:ABC-type antimicrobial peptide transport system permease subunit
LALTRFFATTFFWDLATIFFRVLAGFDAALGAGLLNKVLGTFFTAFLILAFFTAFFTAFLIRAFFATFLAIFAVEILRCFDPEAEWEETGFFFSSFFFFETGFELVLVAATLFFALPF